MKKLLTTLVIFVYFVPASLFLTLYRLSTQETQPSSISAPFMLSLLLMVVVCILVTLNIVGSIIAAIRSRSLSFRTVLIFKLCLIPFYLVNFACWMVASMVFHVALVIWPIIPFVIAYTYFTMLGTSVHIIAKLFTLLLSKKITVKQFVIHSIFLIILAADVIDSIYLSIKQQTFEQTM